MGGGEGARTAIVCAFVYSLYIHVNTVVCAGEFGRHWGVRVFKCVEKCACVQLLRVSRIYKLACSRTV